MLDRVEIWAVARVRLNLDAVFLEEVFRLLYCMDTGVVLQEKGPRPVDW